MLIRGNHKPSLRSVDEAMRRRLHLVPFAVTIPEAERDYHLAEKLKAEWPGILAWAIDGAIAWQTQGLNPPKAVSAATESYFEAEGAIGVWFAERCKKDPQHFTTIAELFRSWKSWAERAGEYVGSAKALSQELDNRGFERNRDGKDRSHVSARRSWGGAVVASSSQHKPHTQPHRQHHHRITHPDSTAPP